MFVTFKLDSHKLDIQTRYLHIYKLSLLKAYYKY